MTVTRGQQLACPIPDPIANVPTQHQWQVTNKVLPVPVRYPGNRLQCWQPPRWPVRSGRLLHGLGRARSLHVRRGRRLIHGLGRARHSHVRTM